MTARVAVVHLIRAANGFEPFERFVRSYEQHDAGRDHDLVLLFKGFELDGEVGRYLERAPTGTDHLRVGDEGFDLTAYRTAAQRLTHDRVCFLNSFSRILADGWLRFLDDALDAPGVGIAGATGSWESTVSLGLRQLGVPCAYPRAFLSRSSLLDDLRHEAGDRAPNPVAEWLFIARATMRSAREFRSFPSPHVRTNAFLIGREAFLDVPMPVLASKRAALVFENGRRGLTATIRARGLRPVLVDRSGTSYPEQEWVDANVFWQESQQQLLVADNQTDAYDAATPRIRGLRSRKAWGARARGTTSPSSL